MTDPIDEPTDGGVSSAPVTDRGFRPLLEKLSTTRNFDFREYKEASLARRIRARMSQVHVDAFDVYATYLDEHPEEYVSLFNTMLINVTGFFRDAEAWKVLASEIIPRVVEEAGASRSIRVWSAGCSSGEEPYSIAILLAEHLGERVHDYNVKIYGTEVDEEALATARHAMYRVDQLKDVPDSLLDRYFARDGQLYRLRRDVRRWCIFGVHNLTQVPPLSHIDLLVCRNVLIYFSGELQERVLARFHYAVRESGYLFLGRSESLLARSRLFSPVQLKWRMFQRLPAVARQVSAVLPERSVELTSAPDTHRAESHGGGARVHRALEALPSAVIVIDMMDTILSWNIAAEHLFDIPMASAIGRKFRDLDISYRVDGLRARIEDVKARHAPARMEDVTFTHRNGEMVHAELVVIPLFEGRRAIGVLVSATEATELARLKEQMTRVAEQHATAIEELQSTNEELETTNEELQSTNEELETTNEELQSTNEELETTVAELQATNAELGTLNAEMEVRTAELNTLNSQHYGLINSLDQALVVMDRAKVVTTWNQAAEHFWGLRRDQAVGREFVTLPIGEAAKLARSGLERVVNDASRYDVPDIPYTLPGGEVRRVTLHLAPLKGAAGEVIGAIGVLIVP